MSLLQRSSVCKFCGKCINSLVWKPSEWDHTAYKTHSFTSYILSVYFYFIYLFFSYFIQLSFWSQNTDPAPLSWSDKNCTCMKIYTTYNYILQLCHVWNVFIQEKVAWNAWVMSSIPDVVFLHASVWERYTLLLWYVQRYTKVLEDWPFCCRVIHLQLQATANGYRPWSMFSVRSIQHLSSGGCILIYPPVPAGSTSCWLLGAPSTVHLSRLWSL